ncbi:Rhs family protein [Yersinia enterocolitica]|uniref:RHS repeat-associated core domain-containing protein n=1 Tax=Yersinia enterocolitica TaxID=630 RepID=UPI0005E4B65C|nr:RHS repeat-associated core domain-containing protein [Yersinia enterocolitica]CQH97669.1 Rhs family protein [Yersinia enterocolitica]
MTQVANYFTQSGNFISAALGGVDPRTGLYSFSFPIASVVANNNLGPEIDVSLHYNILDSNNIGLGIGFSFSFSQYDALNKVLYLSTGDKYHIYEGANGVEIEQKKVSSFKFERNNDNYIITYKSGLVEILEGRNSGQNIKNVISVFSPLGHEVHFHWIFKGFKRLASIRDANRELLKINYDDMIFPEITIFSGTQEQRTLQFQLFNNRLQKITLVNNKYQWVMAYTGEGYIEQVTYPSGLIENVDYQNNLMRFPENAVSALPAAVRHTITPGTGQQKLITLYEYTNTNYLGFASGANFLPNSDNAYRILTDYQYGSTETQLGDKHNIVITRRYNNFHLIMQESTQQGSCSCTVETEYYAQKGTPFDQQPAQFQLPKQTTTTFLDNSKPATEQRRVEITKTEFDLWGNPTKEENPDGSVVVTCWYASQGEENCPAEPNGFVRFMKQQKLIPAGSAYTTPIRTCRFTYQRLGNTPYVVQEKKFFYSDDQLLSQQNLTLISDANDAEFGRIIAINEDMYELSDSSKQFTSTQRFTTQIQSGLLTQIAKFIGSDGVTSTVTHTHSAYTGLLYAKTDAQGITTHYQYDEMGRLTSRVTCPGTRYENTTRWDYLIDGEGKLSTTETDAAGNKLRTYFDGLGRTLSQQQANAEETPSWYEIQSYSYNQLNEITAEKSSDWWIAKNQRPEQYAINSAHTYDNWGEITKAADSDGITRWQVNNPIQLTQTLHQSGNDNNREIDSGSSKIQYDINLRPLSTTRIDTAGKPRGVCHYAYDGLGRLCQEEDELGHVTLHTYDAYDRLVSQTTADGSIVTRTYPGYLKGNCVASLTLTGKNSAGKTQHWLLGTQNFDSLGRLIESSSCGRTTSYRYQEASPVPFNIITPEKEVINLSYIPELNNSVQSLNANGITQEFSYDPISGRLLDAKETDSVDTQFSWHPSGSLKTETVTHRQDSPHASHYRWTLRGRNTTFTDITGAQTRYNRNTDGRIIEVADDDLNARLSYNPLGYLASLLITDGTTQNSLKTQLSHDDFGREISRKVTDSKGIEIIILQTWLANDQLATRITKHSNITIHTENYGYDERNRLISYVATGSNLSPAPNGMMLSAQRYTYDALNNLTHLETTFSDGTTDSVVYRYLNDDDPTQLTSITHTHPNYPASIALDYDANGRMIKDESGRMLTYDVTGRLIGINGENLAGGSYSYDALNRLVTQNVSDDDKRVLYYQGNELANEVIAYQASNNRLIKLNHTCLGVKEASHLTLTATDNHANLLWSREVANNSGTLNTWSPYGYGYTPSPLPGFNGERLDPVSRSNHLGNGYRAYNPLLMRFNCPDSLSPFGAGGINPYAYCAGDPINRLDPSGHLSGSAIAGIVLGALGLLAAIFSAGASIIAAGGVMAAISSTSAISLVVGSMAVVSDTISIVSAAISDSNPEASSVLGWISLGTGISGLAGGVGRGVYKGISRATSGLRTRTANILEKGLSGRSSPAAARTWASEDLMTFYRGDDRSPEAIRKAGGFYPRSGDSSKDVLTRFKKAFSEDAAGHSQAHVRQGNPDYISFGTDLDSGGYADTRSYFYEVKIPGLRQQNITAEVIGTQSVRTGPKVSAPRLLLDGHSVDTSNFVAMLPARTVEATFVTPVPIQFISRYRMKGGSWMSF